MKRVFFALLLVGVAVSLMQTRPVQGQQEALQISLLDKNGKPVASIVDGNEVRLQYALETKTSAEARIVFGLNGAEKPIGECAIQTGEKTCETIPFSALGWYWDSDGNAKPERTILASVNGIEAPGSLIVSVHPRPVVMAHGFNSDYTAWKNYLGPGGYLAEIGLQGFAVGDGQVPGVLQTGSLSDPFRRTNTIAQNAVILGQYIANVQQATGAEKVDLLVHSMGGMISRYYLDRVMTTDNVAQLIILGTPMAGTACSILPASLGLMIPASLEIQPAHMVGVFNQQIVRRQGVPFYLLAGTKLRDAVASPCTPVPSDIAVALDSARAIPMPVEEISLLHTELNTSREVFEGFVTRHLKSPPGSFETAVDPPPGSNAPASQQFSRVYTGHVNQGETEDVIINIDPNVTVANFALFDTSRSLDIAVTGASGNRIELDPIANGIIRVDDPSTMVYLGYGFKQPKPGRWVVTLESTQSTPTSGADFAIAAQFNGGAILQTTQDATVPRVNQTVTIAGSLTADGGPVALTEARAILRKPDGSSESLEMTLSGNQAQVEIAPDASGIHGVEVYVLAQTADGNIIDRAAFLTFEAQPTQVETTRNLLLAVGLIVGVVAGMVLLIWRRLKRRRN